MRIGVYVCECGVNISATVDVENVVKEAKRHPGVKVSRHYKYMCSDPGQDMIKKDIHKLKLDRVVVASCSPLMHESTFRKACEEAGLNKYCFEMANIREQCSWVHKDKKKGTEKAIAIVRGAVAKAALLQALEEKEVPVTKRALVIGAGIAGIQTALDIADMGFPVTLVERSPSIGGHMAQLDKTFPTLDCSACILTPKMVDAGRHPNIELLTYAEVDEIDGFVGNFKATIRQKPRYIDVSKCTGCGDCAEACPIVLSDDFNMGLSQRKAAYIPFPQAVPQKFVIDKIGQPPCADTCPAGVDVQGTMALIKEGKYIEAVNLVREKNPLPGVCGRVCMAFCEESCNRKDVDEPIAVRALRRFICDYEREHETPEEWLEKPTGKKVAIVGSGPAGLTAANNLARMGYRATIFEAHDEAGGMLRMGIPSYRLPRQVLDHDIKRITDAGVEIKTGSPVKALDDLRKVGFEAIFLGTGAHKPRILGIEGEDLDGVFTALGFLHDVNTGKKVDLSGRTVAVIGGGNVAIDAARMSLRSGAKKVFILYRRSRAEMPCGLDEIEECEEEGVDCHYLAAPTKLLGMGGKVTAMECIKMRLGEPDESGRRRP
ncbi:MAG: FAD-dependent oxidoreductase, partial [Methanopyri archaeon]|nr:FAD-dependent oxidoreductase [Methanopyri archaeon]